MTENNQNKVVQPLKLFNASFQPSNLLSLILFFAFGLSPGILLTFQLKNVSFNFQFNEFSPSTTNAADASSPSPVTPIMGFKDFIHPSKLNHNMTDQELIWLASMVPKVRKYPFNRIPTVAFMFLTRGSVIMSPLWEKFFKGHNGLFTIYVHSSNLSSSWTEPESSVFHGWKIPSKSSAESKGGPGGPLTLRRGRSHLI